MLVSVVAVELSSLQVFMLVLSLLVLVKIISSGFGTMVVMASLNGFAPNRFSNSEFTFPGYRPDDPNFYIFIKSG